jgi:hypothetical protein
MLPGNKRVCAPQLATTPTVDLAQLSLVYRSGRGLSRHSILSGMLCREKRIRARAWKVSATNSTNLVSCNRAVGVVTPRLHYVSLRSVKRLLRI